MASNNTFSYRNEIKQALEGVPEGEKKQVFSQLVQFSKMQVQELLELSNSEGISAGILKQLGVSFEEKAPTDEKSIEIEEYMKEVENSFNDRLNNINISSIKYIKGNGGVECTSSTSERISKADIKDLVINQGIHISRDKLISKGERCAQITFNIPGNTEESVIIEFESLTDDEILYKQDLIILKNLLIGKNIGSLIEEKSKKLKERYSDGKTGLYNSTYFDEILSRKHHNYSGIFIDISLFKKINDENGQDFGDEAIKEVAKFLEKSVRPGDKVVRIGGDEFFILFENGKNTQEENKENIKKFVDRMKEKSSDLKLLNPDNGNMVDIGLKLGYAVSNSDDGKNSKELLKIANDMLDDEKDPEGKAYRILSNFKDLKEDAVIPTIKFLISNEIFTDKFFPALFKTKDEGGKFFSIFHSIIYDKVSALGKLNIQPEEMEHMREYLEYIQLFRTKDDNELREFFSN